LKIEVDTSVIRVEDERRKTLRNRNYEYNLKALKGLNYKLLIDRKKHFETFKLENDRLMRE